MNSQPAIEVNNLVKKFGSFMANDHLTFSVYAGEIFGFLGANGAGKTTALRILSGLSKPTAGSITIAGFDVYKETEKIKGCIGYMSQKFSLYEDLTIVENMSLYGGIYSMSTKQIKSRISEILSKLHLEKQKNTLIASLPLGIKQKLAFSIAIFHTPRIVFLDEPTGGVDPLTRRQFWELLYEAAHQGITVFVTTHYMDEAEYCDRVSIMNEGKIVALDTPQNLKRTYAVSSIHDVFLSIVRPEGIKG